MEFERVMFTGRPTGPDVEKIEKAFPSPKPGDMLPYDEVSILIETPIKSSRFVTVLNSYRRKMEREHKVFFAAVPNKGIVVMEDGQAVEWTGRGIAGGFRKISRFGRRVNMIPTENLTEDQKRSHGHQQRVVAAIKAAHNTEAQLFHCNVKEIRSVVKRSE